MTQKKGRGGFRHGGGRPKGRGIYGEEGGRSMQVPMSFYQTRDAKKHLLTIRDWLKHHQKDIAWLAENLNNYFDNERVMRLLTRKTSAYKRYDFEIAASFDVSSAAFADDARLDEFDPYIEFGEPGQVIFWPVRGDSMLDAGIKPGDELVVERINYPMQLPNTGDIVIARVDEMLTVKTYKAINGKEYLVPANPELQPKELIQGEMEFHVYGIVRKLIRTF
jgi:DNA polymerase V